MAYLPILTYHRLLAEEPTRERDPKRIAVSVRQFRQHLTWLKRLGYRTLRLEQYPRMLRDLQPVPPRTIGITFDDGYVEVLTLGLPVLQEFGMTATVFAVAGAMGGTNTWDDGSARLMTGEQYRELAAGGVTIGSHTSHHVHLPRETDESARDELLQSKRTLEEALGQPVTLLAYPYGETDDRIDRMAREAGYEAAFATDRAGIDHHANLYRLRRPVVFPKNSTLDILLKAQRWYPRYQDWK